jgi:hypothetical protein
MRVTRNGKVWRSEAEWRTICARYGQSGLGVAQFCAREQLAVSSFQMWYRRCQQRASGPGQVIELAAAPPTPGGWEVELELPNGARLRLRG